MPDGVMATAGKISRFPGIAIGEQERGFALIRLDSRRVDAENVRPVEEISDATEAFRLALRAIGRSRAVKARELGVRGWVHPRLNFQREGRVRDFLQQQPVGRSRVFLRAERAAVELDADKAQVVAVEGERRRGGAFGIAAQGERGDDLRRRPVKRDVEPDGVDQKIGRAVIDEADGDIGGVAHEILKGGQNRSLASNIGAAGPFATSRAPAPGRRRSIFHWKAALTPR